MSDRSDRRVKFQLSSSPKSHRGREHAHDSGVGSSSSDQASRGGRVDRRFTAEDYESQLYNVSALQEALGQANKKVAEFQQKCFDLDIELAKAHKDTRDTEKLYRDECERSERLQRLNKDLEDDRVVMQEQNQELKAAFDEMRDERNEYHQRYIELTDPVVETTMRGGSGEPASPRLSRTGSRRDKDYKESRGPGRKHPEHREEKASSSRHHRRSMSVSVKPGARSSSKKPYIEKMPEPSSPTVRYSGNYVTASTDYPSASRTVPRISAPAPSSAYQVDPPNGNYVAYPLHEHRGRHRG
ncbi:hypothetical protein GGR54DRAFT_21821 [Hypoxylon sp. NC1633]|nr:hypothetical protein GGR54DRAFT_21821 [Hypoxylon sp. NC1633]